MIYQFNYIIVIVTIVKRCEEEIHGRIVVAKVIMKNLSKILLLHNEDHKIKVNWCSNFTSCNMSKTLNIKKVKNWHKSYKCFQDRIYREIILSTMSTELTRSLAMSSKCSILFDLLKPLYSIRNRFDVRISRFIYA